MQWTNKRSLQANLISTGAARSDSMQLVVVAAEVPEVEPVVEPAVAVVVDIKGPGIPNSEAVADSLTINRRRNRTGTK